MVRNYLLVLAQQSYHTVQRSRRCSERHYHAALRLIVCRGARVHSDSWTTSASVYDTNSQSVDLFAWLFQDFLPVFAAGNFGARLVDGTIASPSTAKNCISVGVALSGLQARRMMEAFWRQSCVWRLRHLALLLCQHMPITCWRNGTLR